MPREFGSGSAIHEYFQEWVERGLFEKLWRIALEEYDELVGIDWLWQGLNGAITKAPLGGEKKQVGTRRIGANGESSDRHSRTIAACH
jgi:transposase